MFSGSQSLLKVLIQKLKQGPIWQHLAKKMFQSHQYNQSIYRLPCPPSSSLEIYTYIYMVPNPYQFIWAGFQKVATPTQTPINETPV